MSCPQPILTIVALATVCAWFAPPADAQDLTDRQRRELAMRAAQVDALGRLTERIRAAKLYEDATVGEMFDYASSEDVALRVALREAEIVGEVRHYSDGISEVDLQIPLADVLAVLEDLAEPDRPVALAGLKASAIEGFVMQSGRGRPPEDIDPAVAARAVKVPRETLPELFPLGWQRVSVAGRVQAERDARIRAYRALTERVRSLRLNASSELNDDIAASPVAEAKLDRFIRSLPVEGRPRLMPDRIAELEVRAPVADLGQALRQINDALPKDMRWSDGKIDQLPVRLKADALRVVGRGMPAKQFNRARERPETGTAPLPDWAVTSLGAEGRAPFPEHVDDDEKARLLAARSAKAKAADELRKKLDAFVLDDTTVRELAAKNKLFRRDIATFLSSARVVNSRQIGDDAWEVTLELPLIRLYEFSRGIVDEAE